MTQLRAARSPRTCRSPRGGRHGASAAPRARRRRFGHGTLANGLLASCVAGVIAAWPAAVAAEPCGARAQLVGDREAVAAVTQELGRLGVQVVPPGAATPGAGCRTVRAAVELDREGGISVAVSDGAQRSEGRAVSDAAVAAAWIESFVRDDVDGFQRVDTPATTGVVMRGPASHAAAPAPAPAPAPSGADADADATNRDQGSVFERFGTSVALEQSWPDGDGVRATGVAGAFCARVGRLCLGVRARYASEADRAVNLTAMARSDMSALATASTAFVVGHVTIAPELGLGAGRISTRRLECAPAPAPSCDPATDPTCDPNGNIPPAPGDTSPDGSGGQCTAGTSATLAKLYVGDKLNASTYTPRAAAALRVSVPLFDHVWLEGVAAFEVAPFGHAAAFTALAADGTQSKDTALPGEPVDTIQLAIGLRVGAP